MLHTLDQATLKENLDYNKESGIFTWKIKASSTMKIGDVAGTPNRDGYLCVQINKERFVLHRLAWLFVYGNMPTEWIDHINGNPADNRIANLREASHTDNMRNLPMLSTNKSGKVGVCFDKVNNKWLAYIGDKTKTVYLGRFLNLEDACHAREAAEKEMGYHENHGRKTRCVTEPVL